MSCHAVESVLAKSFFFFFFFFFFFLAGRPME